MYKDDMKNRWIGLYVENDIGVLAKVSGLFSGKFYNLQSLTVGTTEQDDVSRMTICVTSNDQTFEQIKKQLNSMIEVIKVIDLSDSLVHMKELLYAKIGGLDQAGMDKAFQIAKTFDVRPVDIGKDSVLLECLLTVRKNDDLVDLIRKSFKKVEIVRGGAVAIESISTHRK